MRNILLASFLGLLLYSCGQHRRIGNVEETPIIDPFVLTIQKYNHAERLFKGESKYILTEKKLEIINVASIGEKETIIYSKNFSPNDTLLQISKVNIDSLEEFYDNHHLMLTSGDEINVKFKKSGNIKEVHLHSYYNEQIGILIFLVNELTPNEYKIIYDKIGD